MEGAEIHEVLEIQGGERQVIRQAASCDPHVIRGTGPPSVRPGGREPSPGGGHCFVTGKNRNARQPVRQRLAIVCAPLPDLRPLRQLPKGDERDDGLSADQASRQRTGELSLVNQGRDIGVEDYRLHGSGDLSVSFGIRVGQELLELFVRLEGVRCELIERPDRHGPLRGE